MNSKKPYFSIITPVKNGDKYIKRYLNSLKNQKFKDWEAIIVEDGSIDNSLQVLQCETFKDKRFKILINSNLKKNK